MPRMMMRCCPLSVICHDKAVGKVDIWAMASLGHRSTTSTPHSQHAAATGRVVRWAECCCCCGIGHHKYAGYTPVSYTHLRAHETGRNLVCRLLLEKKK